MTECFIVMEIKEKMINSPDSSSVDFQVMVAFSDSQLCSYCPSGTVLFAYSTMKISIKMQLLKVQLSRKDHIGTKKQQECLGVKSCPGVLLLIMLLVTKLEPKQQSKIKPDEH